MQKGSRVNTKCLIVLVCSVLGIQALHCSDAGPADAGISFITRQLFQALVKPTVTVEEVQKLLDEGAEVHATNNSGRTLLHWAIYSMSPEACDIVQLLLANGADVDAIDNDGRTPLHHVIHSQGLAHFGVSPQALQIIDLFVANGANVNARDYNGRTPLHDAVADTGPQSTAIVQLLLANGADVNAIDNDGETPLELAIHAAKPEIIDRLGIAIAQQRRWSPLRSAWVAAFAAATAPGGGGSAGVGAKGLMLQRSAGAGGAQKLFLSAHQLSDALLEPIRPAIGKERGSLPLPAGTAAAASDGDPAPGGGGTAGVGDARLMLQRSTGAGRAADIQKLSLSTQQLFNALLEPTVTVEEIEALFASGAEVHARDKCGQTPLHCVVYSCSPHAPDIVDLLLARGANVNAIDNNDKTPRDLATYTGNTAIRDRLTAAATAPGGGGTAAASDAGLMLKRSTGAGRAQELSPSTRQLFNALLQSTVTIEEVQKLLDEGAKVNARDRDGCTPLHYAVSSPSPQALEIVEALIKIGASVDARDNRCQTPLHYVVASDSLYTEAITNLLIKIGANVHARDKLGQTPLHYAARGHNFQKDVMKALLHHGADVRAVDISGKTPIDLTHNLKLRKILKGGQILFTGGVDSSSSNQQLFQALSQPTVIEDIEALLAGGANVNARDKNGQTPLHRAVSIDSPQVFKIIKLLIGKGANVHARDKLGQTPLHYAVSSDSPHAQAIVELLLKCGANVNAIDNMGQTPLHWVIFTQNPRALAIVTLLIGRGANIHAIDIVYKTPIDYIYSLKLSGILGRIFVGKQILFTGRIDPLFIEELSTEKIEVIFERGSDGTVVSADNAGSAGAGMAQEISITQQLFDALLKPTVTAAEIEALLAKGARVDAQDRRSGRNCLHYAVSSQSPQVHEIIHRLIRRNANPTIHDNGGATPLHYAVLNHSLDACMIIRDLIRRGAIVDARDKGGQTPLHYAVASDSLQAFEIVRFLIGEGADVYASDNMDHTPIHYTHNVKLKNLLTGDDSHIRRITMTQQLFDALLLKTVTVEGIKLHLESGADVHATDGSGKTPLHYAAISSSPDAPAIITLFLEKDASVNARDNSGGTPLHQAARSSSLQAPAIIALLLAKSAIVDARDKDGKTPLHYAVASDSPHPQALEMVKIILERSPDVRAALDAIDNNGLTPLHYAVSSRSPQARAITQFLLARGAAVDVNTQDNFGQTPLHYAAGSPSLQATAIVELLLANGADILTINRMGKTPLDIAYNLTIRDRLTTAIAQRHRWPTFRELLAVNIDETNELNETPLHLAIIFGSTKTVVALLQKGANVNAQNKDGQTPLHLAILKRDRDIISLLLKSKAGVNEKDLHGQTPLHLATESENQYFIELLLQNGADPHIKNCANRTSFDIARRNKSPYIFKVLEGESLLKVTGCSAPAGAGGGEAAGAGDTGL